MTKFPKPVKGEKGKRKGTKTSARRKTRTASKEQCDKLFSLFIRARDKHCRCCGTFINLQCAHIVSRRYHSTRWGSFGPCGPVPFDNAIALCARCHMRFTFDTDAWVRWCADHLGLEAYMACQYAAAAFAKPDYDAILAKLKEGLSLEDAA